jgi:hypothetical protein
VDKAERRRRARIGGMPAEVDNGMDKDVIGSPDATVSRCLVGWLTSQAWLSGCNSVTHVFFISNIPA